MAAPLPVCYLNGAYVPLQEARISPLDRGFLFADSVYEVLPVFGGRMYRFTQHFDRLARSLGEIQMQSPHSHSQWRELLTELIRLNGGADMYLYVQVTRGMEFGRNHAFPPSSSPTVFAMASPLPVLTEQVREHGLAAITVEDFRWGRCDIKTTALLANVLMKQRAVEADAQEAIIIRDGEVLEGASTSILMVKDDVIVAPPNGTRILPGTTRDAALELIHGEGWRAEIRPIRLTEIMEAEEVWLAAATRDVLPVTRIDAQPIGNGMPGPRWRKLSEAFVASRSPPEDGV